MLLTVLILLLYHIAILHYRNDVLHHPLPCDVAICSSSGVQGKLVRMIEGSTETVRTDTKDTIRLVLLLLVFAVSASSYVLWEGMKDSTKRSKYQLLLHCILIVTSVIPPELPMQMALAVNSSLMALMTMQASSPTLPRAAGSIRIRRIPTAVPCTMQYLLGALPLYIT